jgi:hypothetical protein
MKWKLILSVLAIITIVGVFGGPYAYKYLDEKYQKAQDPIRIGHINEIAKIAFAYDKKVGYSPLADLVEQQKKPFMVLVGRSNEQEDAFAKIKALNKNAMFINSSQFERILSKGLKQKIVLPRDPQKVPTFAPNVYIYYINEEQMCVAAHLYYESEISEPYVWSGGTFNSHAKCYSKKKTNIIG